MSDVLYDKTASGVAKITLNRPDSMNAMGGELMPLLANYLRESASDPEVRCVVLTGNGRAFCAGGDVKQMAAADVGAVLGGNGSASSAPSARFAASVDQLRQAQRETSGMLHTMPKVTIAAVNGFAVGAGLSIALACDLRIASDQAKFGSAFRNVGFSGDFGGSFFLQKLIGPEKARYLYFTGDILTADEAHNLGMCSKVVPHDELAAEAMKLAEHIAAGPTLAFARMKENYVRGETADMQTLLDQEAVNMILSSQTRDHMEAAKAFVEKRQPSFTGE